ncbi:hypothetical protein JYB64_26910, partial [Algoriphagus aestuarii]|nr:hypothetical protein [Algoriphagus aestuarii]
ENEEDAKTIFDLNDAHSRAIIKQRDAVIQEKGKAKDTDFLDVKTELQSRKNQMFKERFKGRK